MASSGRTASPARRGPGSPRSAGAGLKRSVSNPDVASSHGRERSHSGGELESLLARASAEGALSGATAVFVPPASAAARSQRARSASVEADNAVSARMGVAHLSLLPGDAVAVPPSGAGAGAGAGAGLFDRMFARNALRLRSPSYRAGAPRKLDELLPPVSPGTAGRSQPGSPLSSCSARDGLLSRQPSVSYGTLEGGFRSASASPMYGPGLGQAPQPPVPPGAQDLPPRALLSSAASRASSKAEAGAAEAEAEAEAKAGALAGAPAGAAPGAQKLLEAFIYGAVNSILTVPCMYGYTSIIFRDPSFQPHMAELAKLVLFSSVVHQVVFSLKSSLSFSIGQVQDAGLIFLSTMATHIAGRASDPASVVPTTLVTLALATSLLGVVVYALGRLRLAKLVSYLPMPVVGGYLAFIGFFCFEAGVGLAIGEDVSSLGDLAKAFNARGALLASPAIAGGALLAVVAKKAETWWALPLAIVLMPLGFYGCLWFSGTAVADAQQAGWLAKPRPGEQATGRFWDVWALYDLRRVDPSLMPGQLATWVSMVFVVSFSSCLDVVAISMDMGKELDINHELCTVGLSNVVSGAAGGYTGSYIFSQTIFTYRTGTNTRLVGWVVSVSELLLFMAPFNVMEYVPLFFFSATLIFIAFDLVAEWILFVRKKVSTSEYLVLMSTFVIITVTNDLMLGILSGIGLATLNFIVAYASVSHVTRVGRVHSNVMRDFERRRQLGRLLTHVARFDLHGFLFFGSSVGIVRKVQLLLAAQLGLELAPDSGDGDGDGDGDGLGGGSSRTLGRGLAPGARAGVGAWLRGFARRALGGVQRVNLTDDEDADEEQEQDQGQGQAAPLQRASSSYHPHAAHRRWAGAASDAGGGAGLSADAFASAAQAQAQAPAQAQGALNGGAPAPAASLQTQSPRLTATRSSTLVAETQPARIRFIVLDFTRVTGMDATAISTGLMRVKQVAVVAGVTVVFTSLRPEFLQLLRANHVIGGESEEDPTCKVFAEVGDGLEWIENVLLREDQAQAERAERELPHMPDVPFTFNVDGSRNKLLMSLHAVPEASVWLRRVLVDFFDFDQEAADFAQGEPGLGEFRRLTEAFGLMRFRPGDFVFRPNDPSDNLYIVYVGEILLFRPPSADASEKLRWREGAYWNRRRRVASKLAGGEATKAPAWQALLGDGRMLQRVKFGGIFGDIHFTLEQPRHFAAVATEDTAVFYLSKSRFMDLQQRNPKVALGLYRCISKVLAMTVSDLQDNYK